MLEREPDMSHIVKGCRYDACRFTSIKAVAVASADAAASTLVLAHAVDPGDVDAILTDALTNAEATASAKARTATSTMTLVSVPAAASAVASTMAL